MKMNTVMQALNMALQRQQDWLQAQGLDETGGVDTVDQAVAYHMQVNYMVRCSRRSPGACRGALVVGRLAAQEGLQKSWLYFTPEITEELMVIAQLSVW